MSSDNLITTVNADEFRGMTFFSLKNVYRFSKCKVNDGAALGAFLLQLHGEYEGMKARLEAEGKTEAEIKKEMAKATANVGLELDPEIARALAKSNGAFKLPKMLSASISLLPTSSSLQAIKSFQGSIKETICGRTGWAAPSTIMDGLFAMKDSEIQKTEDTIAAARAKLHDDWTDSEGNTQRSFVGALMDSYEADIEIARTAPILQGGLGPLFNAGKYPVKDGLPELFDIQRRYLSFSVPENLPPALREQALAEMKSDLADARDTMISGARAAFAQFVDNATEKLQVQPGSKPPIFRDSLIGNIKEFCAAFDSRNFFNDDQLSALVDQARKIVEDVDPEKLRKFASVREGTAAALAGLQTKLDEMKVERKSRAISFD